MKYLIIGSKGQLGREFQKHFDKIRTAYSGYDIDELDISIEKDVFDLVENEKPSVILNCAAYNKVDNAEKDRDTAFAVNAIGVRNLTNAAEKYSSFLVHYSSDYIFDGKKTSGLYTEEDSTNPINIYGESKLAGEKAVLEQLKETLVFRLSWVFGEGQQNFIYKLQQWAKSNDYLKIVCDEFSVPTSTSTVVEITIKALDTGVRGLYHLTNSGYCSRYEWARHILRTLEQNIFVYPCYMSDFNLPARRPKFSAMSNNKISNDLGIDIAEWQEAVRSFLLKK
jgi:dTDP-4-dehydrorhamnose reductase